MDNNQGFSHQVKRIILRILFFVAMAFILGFVVLLLWNFVITRVTNFPAVNYWQAVGLLILFRILFGSFHFGKMFRQQNIGGGPQYFLKDKLMNMDEADRDAFKEEWRKRCERRDSH